MTPELEQLYEIATDDEKDVLDRLLDRAGIMWTCHGPHPDGRPSAWTMDVGQPCEICGATFQRTEDTPCVE
jgi:hypothetical protein